MKKSFYKLAVIFIVVLFIGCGCITKDKVETLAEDVTNIVIEQVAFQLENSLNQELPGVQVNVPQVINSNGEINWEEMKQTELSDFVFYNFGSYEFRAVLQGDGIFKIERINYNTGETFSYAEFGVQMIDGMFKVKVK